MSLLITSLTSCFCFVHSQPSHTTLPTFPTRRSSDLRGVGAAAAVPGVSSVVLRPEDDLVPAGHSGSLVLRGLGGLARLALLRRLRRGGTLLAARGGWLIESGQRGEIDRVLVADRGVVGLGARGLPAVGLLDGGRGVCLEAGRPVLGARVLQQRLLIRLLLRIGGRARRLDQGSPGGLVGL